MCSSIHENFFESKYKVDLNNVHSIPAECWIFSGMYQNRQNFQLSIYCVTGLTWSDGSDLSKYINVSSVRLDKIPLTSLRPLYVRKKNTPTIPIQFYKRSKSLVLLISEYELMTQINKSISFAKQPSLQITKYPNNWFVGSMKLA